VRPAGLTIKKWCVANGIKESVYYNRLNRLRKMGLDVCEKPSPNKNYIPVSRTFAQIPVASAVPSLNKAIRIRHGDTVVEVSSDAPDNILSFMKEVMFCAI